MSESSTSTRPSLFDRLVGRDHDAAWREFDERYSDLILAWCRRLGLREWDADDVRQQVMIGLHRALGAEFRYRPELGRFRDYLARAVRNTVARLATSTRRDEWLRSLDLAIAHDSSTGRLDDAWEEEWRDHHLRRALAHLRGTLGSRNREMFERLLRGESHTVIASAFDVTEENVRKVKERVFREIRERVRTQIHDEERLGG
jgi:RNA polymerase sigma factor (sigma-70 family)